MSEVLFRCSGLSQLVCDSGEGLTDNQKIELNKLDTKSTALTPNQEVKIDQLRDKRDNPKSSKTLKTCVEDKWRRDKHGFHEHVSTDGMLKGHLTEAGGRKLIRQVLGGEPRLRYGKQLSNDFIIGTPDIVLSMEDIAEDVKNSQTLKTFMNAKPTDANIWQGHGYMWLTNKSHYRICYTLNEDPYEIIQEKQKRIYFKYNCDESNDDYIEEINQIQQNSDLIKSLSPKERLKVFDIERSKEKIEFLKERIMKAREYYKTIKL